MNPLRDHNFWDLFLILVSEDLISQLNPIYKFPYYTCCVNKVYSLGTEWIPRETTVPKVKDIFVLFLPTYWLTSFNNEHVDCIFTNINLWKLNVNFTSNYQLHSSRCVLLFQLESYICTNLLYISITRIQNVGIVHVNR